MDDLFEWGFVEWEDGVLEDPVGNPVIINEGQVATYITHVDQEGCHITAAEVQEALRIEATAAQEVQS